MKKCLVLFALMVGSLGMIAQSLVYTPALKNPADGAINQMPNVILSWNAVTGTVNLQYQFQMDTTAAFNSPLLVDETLTLITGYQTSQLLFNTGYFWRVRAIDGGITTPWSAVWSFTVFDMVVPDKPKTDGQECNVTLEWKKNVGANPVVDISGVDFFDYEADTSLNFNSPILQSGTVAGTIFKAPTHMLRFGTQYHWRVRARHATDISNWCVPLTFTVLDEVTLSSPANNAGDQMLDALLKWKTLGGIMAFDYQIATDEAFTNLILNGFTVDLQVNAEFTKFGIDYFWRVRARHQVDTTEWSDIRKFTTINTVLLKTPSDGQTSVSVTPTFYWTAQTAITGYQLQVATDMMFSDIFWDVKPAAAEKEIRMTKKLNSQTTYYWRMRAFSDGTDLADTTDWSTPWSFVTGFPQAIGDEESTTFRIYPNPASDQAFINFRAAAPSTAKLTFMDLVGKTVLQQDLTVTAGDNLFPIPLTGIRKGLYVVRLTIEEETVNRKLVVE